METATAFCADNIHNSFIHVFNCPQCWEHTKAVAAEMDRQEEGEEGA